jgi:hypothetical protein
MMTEQTVYKPKALHMLASRTWNGNAGTGLGVEREEVVSRALESTDG